MRDEAGKKRLADRAVGWDGGSSRRMSEDGGSNEWQKGHLPEGGKPAMAF